MATTTPREEMVLKRSDERDEFTTVELILGEARAAEIVHSTLKGLTSTPTEGGLKFRTSEGMLVALLRECEQPSPGVQSLLEYRTAPASEAATRKARKIRTALEPYAI